MTNPESIEKKQMLQIGTRVLVAHNLEGNMDEPFIGNEGVITRLKKNDWYQVILDNHTIYGKRFNFHIDELEIQSQDMDSEFVNIVNNKFWDLI